MTSGSDSGIQFPSTPDGRRSTSETARAVFEAAFDAIGADASRELRAERRWRERYPHYVRQLVERSLERPENAIAIARAGLDTTRRAFQFWRDGQPLTLDGAMAAPATEGFRTVTLEGRDRSAPVTWEVPYRGQTLSGDALLRQLDVWERAGVVEPSHAEALRLVQRNPAWLDLSDRTLVLLGAASEAGPFPWLMRWRANVAAVDLQRPHVWQRLTGLAASGNGRLLAPVASTAPAGDGPEYVLARAGADLLTQAPEIAAWLKSLPGDVDIASLAYLDGERHVRVSVAMDAIVTTLSEAKPGTSLAYMATPTDVFAVPEDITLQAARRYDERALFGRAAQAALRGVSRGTLFQPAASRIIESSNGQRYGTVDCIVLQQGPNYALAKRLQQWRAMVNRAAGQHVSINVAPSTATQSVVKNPLLAAGFRGASTFDVEIFEPATTNALMAAMWVHDLRNPAALSNPAVPLRHPLELIMNGANHGGMWRLPYLMRTVLPLAALRGFTRRSMY
ncbi:hypothetical protein HPC49_13000 [Pyxidicoccus fallax]|uniref:Uncharacterized protein n=1 Tax=Pyxidicoccus fallax TaxID=394095 RepID=A0A848LLQ6_9BACT|nr:hypothetical protein [Pyxidicoccus fallax]NMO18612.1 hypothetical protein [Pyxidicoccus fallax]NPC79153.1 hypothetical protein [Pyxidicoccus fallax]